MELDAFFEFAHKAKSTKGLKKTINDLLKDANEKKLRLVVKILRTVLRQ